MIATYSISQIQTAVDAILKQIEDERKQIEQRYNEFWCEYKKRFERPERSFLGFKIKAVKIEDSASPSEFLGLIEYCDFQCQLMDRDLDFDRHRHKEYSAAKTLKWALKGTPDKIEITTKWEAIVVARGLKLHEDHQ